jgi:hypothetical protein
MPEQLDALPPLCGYVKHGNLVTDLETCYPAFPRVQPGFVPRAEPTSSAPSPLPPAMDNEPAHDPSAEGAGLLFE